MELGYGSHMPILAAAVGQIGNGDVMELGAGKYSTPLLNVLCRGEGQKLITAENDPVWLEEVMAATSPTVQHLFVQVENWDTFAHWEHQWAVVLVDHAPGTRRARDIERLRANTRWIVVHDTETRSYKYEAVLRRFKYRYDYKDVRPWTTVVSDQVEFTL